jgi:hypothetical protein
MRKVFILLIILLFSNIAVSEEPAALREGREIMQKVEKSNRARDEMIVASMTIVDTHGTKRLRQLKIYRKESDNSLRRELIRFTGPKDVKGTGLLTIEQPGGESLQWLYLPILRKSKRIAESGRTQNFVGTDYTFEDLAHENLNAHRYRVVRTEVLEGDACYVIEAVPKTEDAKRATGYEKRLLWINKNTYVYKKIEYFNKEGVLFKSHKLSLWREVTPGIWRAEHLLMERLDKKHQTITNIQERILNKGISNEFFSLQQLERE